MRAAIFAVLFALAPVAAPAAGAYQQENDYRCESLAVKAAEDANKELEDAAASRNPKAIARATGQACALMKNSLDNMYILKCSAELTGLVDAQYRKQRQLMEETNSKFGDNARCVFGGR